MVSCASAQAHAVSEPFLTIVLLRAWKFATLAHSLGFCMKWVLLRQGKATLQKHIDGNKSLPLKHSFMRIFCLFFVFALAAFHVQLDSRMMFKAGSDDTFVGMRAVGQRGAGCVYCCTHQVPATSLSRLFPDRWCASCPAS